MIMRLSSVARAATFAATFATTFAMTSPRAVWAKVSPFTLPLISVLSLSLSGCNKTSIPAHDTFVVALAAGPSTIDPRFATDATGSRLAGLLFSSLVRTGPDINPVGEAAIDWTYSSLTYKFRMRGGLTFSNGRAVTGQDIEYSFDQFVKKGAFASAFAAIESYSARYDINGGEVALKLKRPSATLLSDLASIKILPKMETESAGTDFGLNPIGSGPFTLESLDANEIRLRARVDHPYVQPKIRTAVFKVIRDDNTRALKLMKGEVDLAQQELPPIKIAQVEKSPHLRVFKYPGLGMTYLLLNLEDPFLAKKEVRIAMSRAIDRDPIIRYKLEGLALPATSLLSPIHPYFDSNLLPIKHDSLLAQREIAHEQRRHTTISNRELVLKTSSNPAAAENGKILVRQLKDAGLQVRLQTNEWATFYGDVQKGNFQLATMRWVGTVDPDLYRKAFHSSETPPQGRNRGRYKNPELDQLLEEGARTIDQEKRKPIYVKVQKIVFEDLPIIPLWYDTEVAVLNRRVKNFEPPMSGDYWNLTRVYKE